MLSTKKVVHCVQPLGCTMCLLKLYEEARVIGQVDIECRPCSQPVLSKEEDHLVEYCIEMADRGFGLGKV